LAPYVVTTLYPQCGEAVVCKVFPRADVLDDEGQAVAEPTDTAACWERANRRARTRSRRYIVSNRLRFMWVLTMEGGGLHGADGRAVMMGHVAGFVRRLRAEVGELPYWYSPELHPGGHGWHCNVFLPKFLPHALVERLWGHGHVWAKDWTRDTRVKGHSFVERLRAGASYGAKYAAKDWSDQMLDGRAHRYEIAQGYEPRAVLAEVPSVGAGLHLARLHLGHLVHVWRSADEADWDGPECAVAMAATMRGQP
jgi:hypothetical protein